MIYGVDVSAYQPDFDFAAARRDGVDFAIIKATEGANWKSSYYDAQVQRARAAGMLYASYHFLRSDSSAAAQVANVRSVVAAGATVIPDVESIKDAQGRIVSAPTVAQTREFVTLLRAAGFRVPLVYLPQWYWNYLGKPDLAGLPPNWHSRYPDDVVRRKEAFVLGDQYWPSFGGLDTAIAQFTSSLAVANYPSGRIDGNAFRGTREQLATLLNGDDDDMTPDEYNQGVLYVRYGDRNLIDMEIEQTDRAVSVDSKLGQVVELLTTLTAQLAKLPVFAGEPADLAAVAKAVNDDADQRDRDGDPNTGETS